MSIKNSDDTIGNRTRDLPICSTVSQPTVLPHAPSNRVVRKICGIKRQEVTGDIWAGRMITFALERVLCT
jgi:hypothetical protein